MWTLLTGIILKNKFVYYTEILHRDDFSNKNIPLFGITLGWLFQEHVREDFFMTGGKRFMIKWDFRYRFLTQSLKVTRNLIYLAHAITTFELGSIMLLFVIHLIILIHCIIFFIESNFEYKDFTKDNFNKLFKEEIIEQIMKLIYKNATYTSYFVITAFHWIIMRCFLRMYGWFDVFFITRPFVLLAIYSYLLLSIFYLIFLTNLCIINNFSKYIGLIFNIIVRKTWFYIFFIITIVTCIINIINVENFSNGNFLKEIFIKLLFFI